MTQQPAEDNTDTTAGRRPAKSRAAVWSLRLAVGSCGAVIVFLFVRGMLECLGVDISSSATRGLIHNLGTCWKALLTIAVLLALVGLVEILLRRFGIAGTAEALTAILAVSVALLPTYARRPDNRWIVSGEQLPALASAIRSYAADFDDRYPTPQKWCDLLVTHGGLGPSVFDSPYDDAPCSYALNPNCEPDSPAETILVFEIPGRWNQHGGPDLFENHAGDSSIVLLNDGRIRRWRQVRDIKDVWAIGDE